MSRRKERKIQAEKAQRRRTRNTWLIGGAIAVAVTVVAVVIAVGSTTPQVGPPDFEMIAYQGQEVLGGDEVMFSSLLGQGKPVVLNFWAGQCPPCRAEMPDFQRVYDERGGEIILVGVDIGPFVGLGSNDDARQLLEELGITYPAAYALNADPVRDYQVRGMPTTIFMTADGEIIRTHSGLLTGSQLRAGIDTLLANAP